MSSSSRPEALPRGGADSQAGFTLIEVIISLVILTFISLGIYQATTQTFKLRESLSVEGDFYNGIRLSMDILQRDLALVSNPMLMLPPKKTGGAAGDPSGNGFVPNGQNPNAQNPANPSEAPFDAKETAAFNAAGVMNESQYWGPVGDKTGLRPSRFQGANNKMSFISASHIRIYRDAAESEFAKIAYELVAEPSNTDVPGSSVLYKVESPNVYEDEDRKDKKIVRYPLLHGVRKLVFKYYRKDKDAWVDAWDSVNGDTKGLYPDEIKVSIEVGGPTKLSYDGEYILRTEVPLHGLDPST
jgi:prepilin-type N-terminal cleavage/methylation domain-containing protein